MEKALSAAAASFGGNAKNPRAMVYIGDGSSRANLLSIEKFQPLATALADQHVSVLSYGVGPRVDRQILDLLAQETGGALIDGAEPLGRDVGRRLAAAATEAAVFWPTAAVKWPAGMGEVFPKALPPLRSDRDTVLIGTLKGKEPLRDRRGGRCPRWRGETFLDGDSRQEHGRQQLPSCAGGAGAGRTAV